MRALFKKIKLWLKPTIKKIYPVVCAYYIWTNLVSKKRFMGGDFETCSGTIHSGLSLEESIKYIFTVYEDYKLYGGIKNFYGRVAEVGPGDNCGVALLCLSDGCEQIDLVDRFYSIRNADKQARIYAELMNQNEKIYPILKDANLSDEKTFPKIKRYYGPSAEAETFFNSDISYNFIISRAVMEHVYDPVRSLEKMHSSLTNGGMMLHKVDLRDHGMFSENFHELKFYEVPDKIYSLMTHSSGRPNRVLIDQYRAALSKLNLDFKLLITRLAGIGDIEPHTEFEEIPLTQRNRSIEYVNKYKNKFANSLSTLKDEDLCVAGFFLIATKRL